VKSFTSSDIAVKVYNAKNGTAQFLVCIGIISTVVLFDYLCVTFIFFFFFCILHFALPSHSSLSCV
jgi:hypothetical protein